MVFIVDGCNISPNCVSQTPVVGIPTYYNGSASGNSNPGFVAVTYSPGSGTSSLTNTVTTLASASHIGTTWGTAYDSRNNTFYAASALKRHAGYAGSPGAIYKISAANTTPSASLLIDLSGKTGTLPGGGTSAPIDAGSASDHGTLGGVTSPNFDNQAYALAGKTSLGDMDISPTRNTLWVVNAKQSQLISINISNPASPVVDRVYPINSSSTGVTPTDGALRPWGIEISNSDDVYIGIVADAGSVTPATPTTLGPLNLTSSTIRESPANRAKLQGYVFKLNKITGAFTQVVGFPLNYNRANPGVGISNTAHWVPWFDDYTQGQPNTGDGYFQIYPQPLISDMDILDDGSMVIGIMDRFGLQTGSEGNYKPGTSTATDERGRASGDVVRVLSTGSGTWSSTISNFYGDAMSIPENTAALGGIAYKSGTNEFIGATVDAINANSNGLVVLGLGGNLLDNQDLISYSGTGLTLPANNLLGSKGNALGDVEIGFAGAPPAPVTPSFSMVQGAPTCTGSTPNNNGTITINTVLNGDRVGFISGSSYTGGPAYAASAAIVSLPFTVIANVPNTGGTYTMRVFNGSDATFKDTTITVAANVCGPAGTVGNYVWTDINLNGLADDGATNGINGVMVELYKETSAGSGVYSLDAATTTANDGMGNPGYYLFTVLSSANYKVKFPTTVSGAALTTQTTTAATDNNSDANTTDDFSPAFAIDINGTGVAKDNLTIDAGYLCGNGITTTNYSIAQNATVPVGQGLQYSGGTSCAGGGGSTTIQVPINILSSPVDNGTTPVPLGNAIMPALPAGAVVTSASIAIPGITPLGSSWQSDVRIELSGAITMSSAAGIGALNGNGSNMPFTYNNSIANGNVDIAGGAINLSYHEDFNDNTGGADATFVTGSPAAGAVISITYTSSNVITYYTAATGGTAIGTGSPFNPVGVAGSGLANTSTPGTTTYYVGCSTGGCRTPVTFTVLPPVGSISNYVWNDLNSNGLSDEAIATAGINGVSVQLLASNGTTVLATTTTANDGSSNPGYYIFSNLVSGTYFVKFPTTNSGNVLTIQTLAALTDGNSDPNEGTGITPAIVIDAASTGQNKDNTTIDAGYKNIAALGDRVWNDVDKDGVQDANEPGVAGITVTLYNGTNVVGTTVTDAYGKYLFTNLTPSTNTSTLYSVGFTLPANYSFTTQTNTQTTGTNNTTNITNASAGTAVTGSDANVTTGKTGSFWLDANENELGVDAGIVFNTPVQLNSIGDKVWFDNGLGGGIASNGLQDGAEPGVAGVTVTLFASNGTTVLATTVTDAAGNYKFTNLNDGSYVVGFTLPAGTVFTTANQGANATGAGGATESNADSDASTVAGANFGKTELITISGGADYINVDAGIVTQPATTASLGDKVWNDLNSNGTQDAGEPGIPGVIVNLYQDANGNSILDGGETTAYATATTDAFGNYMFNNLPITGTNKWQVEFVQPSGYSNTPVANNNSGGDATDSDITNNTTDRTDFITLKADERNTNVDAGFIQTTPAGTLILGDFVFRDFDSDGQQDATEPGVAGVVVKLYQNGPDGLAGTADDVVVGTTSTGTDGKYSFSNLAASTNAATNYNVQFSNVPTGFSFTTQDAGADATDSDVNSLGRTASINLTADNLTIDAGLTQGVAAGLGSLGDKVWFDVGGVPGATANNGVQEAGELGAAGVTVNLYKDADNNGLISGTELTPVATTTTNALGEYLFDGLNAGNYQVGFALPMALSTYTLSPKDAGTNDALDSDGNAKNTSVAGNTAAAQTSFTALIPLAQGEDKLTVDLGLVQPINTNTLGGTVWFDTDSDGNQTGNPANVPGVTAVLYRPGFGPDGIAGNTDDNTPIGTTTTDENGNYLFVGLPDGSYFVDFDNYPNGFTGTVKETTNTPATGSDADVITGRTANVTLGTSNSNDRTLDAGLVSTNAALGNRVWLDNNADGIQDAGEPGVSGVTVNLYFDADNIGGISGAEATNPVASAITDINGNYFFPNLTPGNYQVGFSTIPTGMVFTTKDNVTGTDMDGVNTWTGGGDSDVNPTGTDASKTDLINLSANEVDLTIDAGIRSVPVGSVGNRVWDDLDGDGIQDAGEPGIPGVVATLYDGSNNPIGSAITGNNGEWLITNVPIGNNYHVEFTNKPAGSFTLIHQSGTSGETGTTGDADNDSDANGSGITSNFDVTLFALNVKIDAGITQTMTLPVKFVGFIAKKNGNTSDLEFTIAQAAPSSKFVIERSVNGGAFVALGTLQGTTGTVYNYIDVLPSLNANNFYRIKEIESNGQYGYSETRLVKFKQDGKIEIHPNPAVTSINININNPALSKKMLLRIIDKNGEIVQEQFIGNVGSSEQIRINNLTSGSYIVAIYDNDKKVFTKQLIIIK